MATNKLETMFDEYNNSERLPADFSNEALGKFAKGLSSSSKEEVQTTRNRVPQKIKSIVKIVRTVTENLNARLMAIGNGYRFDTSKVTYSASQKYGKFDVNYKSGTINFNVTKLSKLPALEIYAYVTKCLYEAAVNEIVPSDNKKQKQEKLDELIESEIKHTNLSPEDFERAKIVLSNYLEKFIKKYFPDDFKRFHNIAYFVAGQVIAEMSEKDLSQVLKKFFDFESINGFATDAVVDFLGYTDEARISYISGMANKLLDSGKEIASLSYHEQAQELMSSSVLEKFRKIDPKKGGFEYSQEIIDFINSYTRKFMSAHNLENIPVTFKNVGELGTYYPPSSGKEEININLAKLDKLGSLTELVQTLSHELTHAVDAAKHGGTLENSIGEDISRSGLDGENLSFLKELNKYCYFVNPNEINARIHELSAIEFMQTAAKDDPLVQKDIQDSLKRFVRYQKRTLEIVEGNPSNKKLPLKDLVDNFQKRSKSLERSPISERAKNLISSRVEYLEKISKSIDLEPVRQSIKEAEEMMALKQAEKQAHKKIEEVVPEM